MTDINIVKQMLGLFKQKLEEEGEKHSLQLHLTVLQSPISEITHARQLKKKQTYDLSLAKTVHLAVILIKLLVSHHFPSHQKIVIESY